MDKAETLQLNKIWLTAEMDFYHPVCAELLQDSHLKAVCASLNFYCMGKLIFPACLRSIYACLLIRNTGE